METVAVHGRRERPPSQPVDARFCGLLVGAALFLTPSARAWSGPSAFRFACATAYPALQEDYEAEAATYMSARARITGFSGAVLVARDGRPLFRRAYGVANREHDIPNAPETRFRLASASKQFTAAAVLLLEQRGALAVDDLVGEYLSAWPEAWSEVTVQHLLTHTAGLPRLSTQALLDVSGLSLTTPVPFQEVPDLFKPGEELQPPDFEPGAEFAYSNVGYIVLGLLVEEVAGMPLGDFLAREIFGPANMRDTGCEEPAAILPRRASGYTRIESGLVNAAYVDMRFVNGTGSVYSTVDDLLLWDRVLDSERLLQAPAKERLFTPVHADYACGWWIQTKFGRVVQWHGGNVPGFVAHLVRYPSEKLFIAVLSNAWSDADRGQVRAIGSDLAAIAFGEPYELPRKHERTELSAAEGEAYVGEYVGKDTFAIARDGERLMLQFPPGVSVFELYPESRREFFASRSEYFLTFDLDAAGKVVAVVVRNEGEQNRWTKSR
jgi:CubicO group peptidase (beta-lactamase class C family)